MDAPGARLELEGGRLHITWAELARYLDVAARCRLADGAEHESDDWDRDSPAREGLVLRTVCGPLEVRLELTVESERVRARLSAVAAEDVAIKEIGLVGRVLV